MEDELLDLVNDEDQVVGTISRSDYDRMLKDKLGYLRAVEVFIKNDKGQLWIPRRTLNKRIAPGGLDYSMGGHTGAGESYIEAALREIQEELNLDLKEEDLIFLKKFPPSATPYFRSLYIYRSNEVPAYNPADFSEYSWMTPEELKAKLDAGEPAKLSLPETVDYLLVNR